MTQETNEMSAPMLGSQPVAWLVEQDGELYIQSAEPGDTVADEAVPLYRKPMLTDAERECLEWCLSLPMLDRDACRMMPLRGLLERLG